MATQRKLPATPTSRRPPATTPAARENQLISLAYELAEQRLRSGSATSQEVTHFLKLGSTRERLEQERLAHENNLLKAKREHMESLSRTEELMTKAIDAMRTYKGADEVD